MIRLLKAGHFLTAFLIGVLFPVFLGAAELPPYQKYTGPIKPGIVITKENWDHYLPELQKLFPPIRLKLYGMGVKAGLVTIPIVKTTPSPMTKGQMEATRKNAGTARVGADNQLYDWVAGYPFPEPKNALELIWNAYPTISRGNAHDDLLFHAQFDLLKETKYEKYFTWDLFQRKYRGRTDIPPLGDLPDFKNRGIALKESLIIHEPNEVRGFIQLRIRYWDINKADECYAYIPALRRVRRLTGGDLTDPLLGSDTIPDDFETMRQKLDSRMKVRVLEHKDMLVAKTYTTEMPPDYDYKKHGPCYQVDWGIRPMYVLEIMINDPNYAYSKRIIYMDAVPLDEGGAMLFHTGEAYDQKGRLWRCTDHTAFYGETGFRCFIRHYFSNYQTDHYTMMPSTPAYTKKDFHKIYPLNEDEAFSVKGLLRRAR